MKKCLRCGDKFEITNKSGKEKKYCSRRCADAAKKQRLLQKKPILWAKNRARSKKWYKENRVYRCKYQIIIAKLHEEINESFKVALHELRKLKK